MDVRIGYLKQLISQTSDTYIRHYESEIKYTEQKAKLSLWIIGLSVGIELFILNKVDRASLGHSFNLILFICLTGIFLLNALLGLLIRLKQTRVYSHFLTIITIYDYQKNELLMNLDETVELTEIGKKFIDDFTKGIATEKLKNLEYRNESEKKNDKIHIADMDFLHRSDNVPSSLLVIQAILTVAFSIITLK